MVLSASSSPSAADALASNEYLDPGTSLLRRAPDFTLSDEFGRRLSLRSLRGRVVILAFNDPECTTALPADDAAMLDAQRDARRCRRPRRPARHRREPRGDAIEEVRSYSEVHGMSRQWQFLTGSLAQLRSVWRAYEIGAQVRARRDGHTPALYVIDRRADSQALHDPAGVCRRRPAGPVAGAGGLEPVAWPPAGSLAPLLRPHPGDHAQLADSRFPARAAAASGSGPAPRRVSRSSRPGSLHEHRRAARRTQSLPVRCRWRADCRADRRRRGQRRAVGRRAGGFLAACRLPFPIRSRSTQRPGRRRLPGPGPAVVGARLASGRILGYCQVSTSGWPTARRSSGRSALR